MHRLVLKGQAILLATIVGAVLTTLGASEGGAQQKHRISGKTPAVDSKYTQQHILDVGDVPGHQIRIFEVHRSFAKTPLVFEGIRATEAWVRGFTDYTANSGWAVLYYTYVLENGDKIFAQAKSVTQANREQSGKSTATTVARITGGTGKFLGIRGIIRSRNVIDPKAGLNEGEFDGEYWLQK